MFILAEGHASGVGDDAYISVYEAALAELEEHYPGLEEWLKENMDGKYEIEDQYHQDLWDVECSLILKFELQTDLMAFKLRWM